MAECKGKFTTACNSSATDQDKTSCGGNILNLRHDFDYNHGTDFMTYIGIEHVELDNNVIHNLSKNGLSKMYVSRNDFR